MSQAEALLNTLTVDQAPEDDGVLVVDKYFRTISVPKSIPNLGVEHDDSVLRLHFRVPRYLGDIDLYTFSPRINYSNARGGEDVYDVNDAEVNGDSIEFSWLVGSIATALKGTTKFNVCMKLVDSNNVILKEFNTTPASLPVLEGLETQDTVISEHTDILEQWKTELFGTGTSAVNDITTTFSTKQAELQAESATWQSNIAAKGVETLATIPSDYTATYNMADTALRRKAEAVVMSSSGEYILLDDSSDNALFGLNVYGRTTQTVTKGAQLFNANSTEILDNGIVSYNVCDDLITYSANEVYQTYRIRLPHDQLIAGKTYVLECDDITQGLTCQVLANNVSTSQSIFNHRLIYNTKRIEFTIPAGTDMSIFDTFNSGTAYLAMSFFFSDAGYANRKLFVKGLRLYCTDNPLTAWEPYSDCEVSPRPDWTQELTSVESPIVSIYGNNLANIANMAANSNTSLSISDDGYKIVTTGGSNNAYTSTMVKLDVDMLRGKRVILRADKITSTNPDARSSAQVNIRTPLNETNSVNLMTYTPIDSNNLSLTIDVPYNADDFALAVYTNNTGTALAEDNTVTVEGLGIYLADKPWEPYKTKTTVSLARTLYGVPVSQNGNHTDPNGQQWICDEVDFERGVHIQRCGHYIFDGSGDELWNGIYTHEGAKYVNIIVAKSNSQYTAPTVCNYSKNGAWGKDVVCFIDNYDKFTVGGPALDSALGDVVTFRNYIATNRIELVYALETPVETALSPSELVAYEALRTNATNTTILNDHEASMRVNYGADVKSYLPTRTKFTLRSDDWIINNDDLMGYVILPYTPRIGSKLLFEFENPRVTASLDRMLIFRDIIYNPNDVDAPSGTYLLFNYMLLALMSSDAVSSLTDLMTAEQNVYIIEQPTILTERS